LVVEDDDISGEQNKINRGKKLKTTREIGGDRERRMKKAESSRKEGGQSRRKERTGGRCNKEKKKKKEVEISESDTSDISSDSSMDSSSSDQSASEDSSESSSSRKNKREQRKKKMREKNWELLEDMWPRETRPSHLRKKKNTYDMTLDMLLRLKEQYEKEAEKKGMGTAVYGRDAKVRAKLYPEMKDDGVKRFHPARWERCPTVEPKKYWKKIPTKRDQLFRHIPLGHYGIEGQVSEVTLVRLHDKKVPVELEMFTREKVTEIRHCQEAVMNYCMVEQALWPIDYSALVLQKVMMEYQWGEGSGLNEKQKVVAIKKTFDDVARENSGRAVREEQPLEYEQVKSR
jgi:hypothetical protein